MTLVHKVLQNLGISPRNSIASYTFSGNAHWLEMAIVEKEGLARMAVDQADEADYFFAPHKKRHWHFSSIEPGPTLYKFPEPRRRPTPQM